MFLSSTRWVIILYFFICLFLPVGLFSQDEPGQKENTGETGKETLVPLPDPPSVDQLLSSSDIVIRAKVIRSKSYRLGGKLIGQSRILCVRVYKGSEHFVVSPDEEFTISYYLKPDELGPFFSEPPVEGEYIIFLSLKNLQLEEKIIGYVPRFIYPDPFSIYDMDPGMEKAILSKVN